MAGVLQHLRSSTLDKRPNPASMVDGQVAINYASGSPGMFFKDSNGDLVKVGPVHVGSTAPNVSPASGGTAGNSTGEQWLDTSGGTYVFKIWDGVAWRSEAGEFVNSTGDTMTGSLTMGQSADIIFEGSVDDGFETTLTVSNPTADRTITLPNVTGTVVTTGDSGSVTSTMIADGTIVNADVNASAAIAGSKIDPDFGSQTIETTGDLAINTDTLFVDSSTGNVGLGTSSPGANLVVNEIATSGANHSLQQWRTASGGFLQIQCENLGLSQPYFEFTTGTSEDLILNPGGNVGVGTTSPTQPLDVVGGFIKNDTGLLLPTARYNGASGGAYISTNATANPIQFVVGAANAEAARIDSDGRLLVGTPLSASAGGSQYAKLQIKGNSALSSGNGILSLQSGTTTPSVDSALGTVLFADNTGGEYGRIDCYVDGTSAASDYPGRLVFSTTADGASSPTSRVVINSAGVTIFGTNRTAWSFDADNTQITTTGAFVKGCSATTAVDHCVFYNPNGKVGSIVTSASATAYNETSDYRLKENITAVTDGITRLQQLKPSRFNFIADPTKTVDGFIAHEVQAIVPEAVTGEKDAVDDEGNPEYQGIDKSKLVPLLTAALQEAVAKIESLEARLTAAGI